MQKIKIYLIGLVFVVMPAIGQAAELDGLKADFLQGNYRRVIFESGERPRQRPRRGVRHDAQADGSGGAARGRADSRMGR